MSLSDTFSMMFGEWTEEYAAEEQALMRKELAQVDAARADWRTLHDLGYAQKVDGPAEYSFRWEFLQKKYDLLVADIAMTPKQLADKMNAALEE